MPKSPPALALQQIAQSAFVPAVGYALVEHRDAELTRTALAIGEKDAQSSNPSKNQVDTHTQFPASSLSKIVFTYLVLQLVEEGKIDLDQELHLILPCKRLMVDDQYPDDLTRQRAKQVTVRHVLSHTSGLPNVGSNPSSPLSFNADPGEKYEYSGEGILYLQDVIEKLMGKDLEALAREYVFDPEGMLRSTFLPASKDDSNVVSLHTELGESMRIAESLPHCQTTKSPRANAAGSLLTTADDFSKFMAAWLNKSDDDIFKKAFEPPQGKQIPTYDNKDDVPVCGLGWHLFKDKKGNLIAYQYGENLNTRSFIAFNVADKKSAVFFTNCAHGMSIANKVFGDDLSGVANTEKLFKSMPRHPQSEEPGWKETLAAKRAEHHGHIEEARQHLTKAAKLSPGVAAQKRLEWFNERYAVVEKPELSKQFVGTYTNQYGDSIEIYIKDNNLVYNQFGIDTSLVKVSETDFLPEKDQSFRVSISGETMSIIYPHGAQKALSKQPTQELQASSALYSSCSAMLFPATKPDTSTSPDNNTQDNKEEDQLKKAIQSNPCSICRSLGSPVCKCKKQDAGDDDKINDDDTAHEEGKNPTPSLIPTEEKTIELLPYLEKNIFWRRENGEDHIFTFNSESAIFSIILNPEKGTMLFKGDDTLAPEDKAKLDEFYEKVVSELKKFSMELNTHAITYSREGNTLEITIPNQKLYRQFVSALIAANLFPSNKAHEDFQSMDDQSTSCEAPSSPSLGM